MSLRVDAAFAYSARVAHEKAELADIATQALERTLGSVIAVYDMQVTDIRNEGPRTVTLTVDDLQFKVEIPAVLEDGRTVLQPDRATVQVVRLNGGVKITSLADVGWVFRHDELPNQLADLPEHSE